MGNFNVKMLLRNNNTNDVFCYCNIDYTRKYNAKKRYNQLHNDLCNGKISFPAQGFYDIDLFLFDNNGYVLQTERKSFKFEKVRN